MQWIGRFFVLRSDSSLRPNITIAGTKKMEIVLAAAPNGVLARLL